MKLTDYFETLGKLPFKTEVVLNKKKISLGNGFDEMRSLLIEARDWGATVWLIGNGGSSNIASHIATDLTKNAGIPAAAFTDAGKMTCFANDYGYEHIFAKHIEFHAKPEDVIIAISSSGNSANILKACEAAKKKDCGVITFSGFNKSNKLRKIGHLNFYVPAKEYGYVELTHLALLHCMCDIMGKKA